MAMKQLPTCFGTILMNINRTNYVCFNRITHASAPMPLYNLWCFKIGKSHCSGNLKSEHFALSTSLICWKQLRSLILTTQHPSWNCYLALVSWQTHCTRSVATQCLSTFTESSAIPLPVIKQLTYKLKGMFLAPLFFSLMLSRVALIMDFSSHKLELSGSVWKGPELLIKSTWDCKNCVSGTIILPISIPADRDWAPVSLAAGDRG